MTSPLLSREKAIDILLRSSSNPTLPLPSPQTLADPASLNSTVALQSDASTASLSPGALYNRLDAAICAGNLHTVGSILKTKRMEPQNLPISSAMSTRFYRVLELFLEYGWDINKPMDSVSPPYLALTATDPNFEMAGWFFRHHADPNARCDIDMTPTSYVVEAGSMEMLEYFLANGADVRRGRLLHHSIHRPHHALEFTRRLLDLGCPINAQSHQFEPIPGNRRWLYAHGTALHRAADSSPIELVKLLLEKGADPKLCDLQGVTPRYLAEKRSRKDVADLLKEWEEKDVAGKVMESENQS